MYYKKFCHFLFHRMEKTHLILIRSVGDTKKFVELCRCNVEEKKSLELGLFSWDSFNMRFMLIGTCGFVNVNWNSKSAEIGE